MIVVFGSLTTDIVRPVETLPKIHESVVCETYSLKPGGKGSNQAVAAVRAGAETHMYGRVGDDDFGQRALQNLKDNNINLEGVQISRQPTGCAGISVDKNGKSLTTLAAGANFSARSSQVPDSVLGPNRTLLLQMEVRHEENWELLKRAKALGTRTILNYAPAGPLPKEALADVDYLIMNDREATSIQKYTEHQEEELLNVARDLSFKHNLTCVITLAEKGSYISEPGNSWHMEAFEITPVDTTGAGDAFCGVFAAALDQEKPLDEAIQRATIAGSLACLGLGAQESTPKQETIDQWMSKTPLPKRV